MVAGGREPGWVGGAGAELVIVAVDRRLGAGKLGDDHRVWRSSGDRERLAVVGRSRASGGRREIASVWWSCGYASLDGRPALEGLADLHAALRGPRHLHPALTGCRGV